MPVITAYDNIAVEPHCVYVIPPNASIVLEDGHLRLGRREEGLHLPIDEFFRSLAKVQGSRAIGVVLSGNALGAVECAIKIVLTHGAHH